MKKKPFVSGLSYCIVIWVTIACNPPGTSKLFSLIAANAEFKFSWALFEIFIFFSQARFTALQFKQKRRFPMHLRAI